MALTTLSDLKTFLGISVIDTSEDNLLNLLIGQASDVIQEFCGRSFGQSTYTEFYLGNGQPVVVLNQRPVYAVTSLYSDDNGNWGGGTNAFGPSTLLTEGIDFVLQRDQPDGSSRCGLIRNIGLGFWPAPATYLSGMIAPSWGSGLGNIKVTYTAGYASVPTPLEMACNLLIAKVRGMRTAGTQYQSESDEVYSYSLAADAKKAILSPEVSSILARYRNVAVG